MKAREHLTAPGTQITWSFVHKQSFGRGEQERDRRPWPPPKIPERGKVSVMVIIWKGYKNASFFPFFPEPEISLEISLWVCLVSNSWALLFSCLSLSLSLCLWFFLCFHICFYLFLSLCFGLCFILFYFISFPSFPDSVCVFVSIYGSQIL